MNIKLAILYLVYLSIHLFIDAVHDPKVLKSRPDVTDPNAEAGWHFWDSLQKGFAALTVFILLYIIYYGAYFDLYFLKTFMLATVFFLSYRAFYFNLTMNIVRKLMYNVKIKIFHLSKSGFEGKFKNANIGFIYWIISILLAVLSFNELLKL